MIVVFQFAIFLIFFILLAELFITVKYFLKNTRSKYGR